MVYFWATLLLVANAAAWIATVFNLPGNWLMVLFTGLYVWFLPPELDPRVGWIVVGILAGLAVVGEIVEFLAGAAGAAKQGASKRGIALAIVGAFLGSVVGAVVTIPIPVIGPIIGALGGGALGAYIGAWFGEAGTDRTPTERMAISKGAMIGRLMGTIGKLIIGVVMLVLATIDSFYDLPAGP